MHSVKKILFISHDAELTGAPRELMLIVKHLDKSKYQPIVIVGKDGPLRKQFEQFAEVHIHELFGYGMKYLRELKVARQRLKILRALKPELVYCNTILTSKWLFYAKLLNIPTIVHVHELEDAFELLSSIDRYLLHNYADTYIAASSAVRKYLLTKSSLNPSRIVVFNESIEVEQLDIKTGNHLRLKLSIDEKDIIIGTVGRIARMKGTDLLIEVARKIKSTLPIGKSVKFLIVGGASENEKYYYEEIRSSISMNGLDDMIIVTGFKENVEEYFSIIDIFVLPSREDPFPLVVLEAMSYAKPIVAFASGGVPEMLDSESALLIKGLDVDSMKDSILQLINDSMLRQKMGKEARRRVEQNFNIATNISNVEKLLDSVISSNLNQ